MKIEMTVHFDGFGLARAGEIVGIVAAAAERKVSFRRVDVPGERSVGAQRKRGIRGQAIIRKVLGATALVDDSASTDSCRGGTDIHRDAGPRGYGDLLAAANREAVRNVQNDIRTGD